jgi:hypothetical protein
MYKSGRWRRYYTEEAFLAVLRDAAQGAEHWAKLAGVTSTPEKPADTRVRSPN